MSEQPHIRAVFTFWAGRGKKRKVNVLLHAWARDSRPDDLVEAVRDYLKKEQPHLRFSRPGKDRLEIM